VRLGGLPRRVREGEPEVHFVRAIAAGARGAYWDILRRART
jgi:hypothetical protein